jgi:NAD(P)H-dependent FMN reductase
MTDPSRPVLRIIIASTRPTRVGGAVGEWFRSQAITHDGFDVRVSDLRAIDLPLMDEPHHPSQQNYTKEHTKAWAADIAGSDAFAFVMPEYNHSFTAPLKNALDYLQKEWAYKPVGLVSYGGISGGLRAVTALKPCLSAMRLTAIPEAVVIQFVATHIGEDGSFTPTDHVARSVVPMLDELARVTPVLKQLQRGQTEQ